jgi:hypothetical protein
MKKLFAFLALIAYAFSETCEECDARCRRTKKGTALSVCLSDCILGPCLD